MGIRSNSSNSLRDSAILSGSAASTMYTMTSTLTKYSLHRVRALSWPPRSYVLNVMFPNESSSLLGRMVGLQERSLPWDSVPKSVVFPALSSPRNPSKWSNRRGTSRVYGKGSLTLFFLPGQKNRNFNLRPKTYFLAVTQFSITPHPGQR
jgi:hypothetical protein